MVNLWPRFLIWTRNGVWKIRRTLSWDDTPPTVFYSGVYSLRDFKECEHDNYFDALKNFATTACKTKYHNMIPEANCLLQYEEKGQLLSLHYFLDEKFQLHIRLFSRWERSEMSRMFFEVDVYSHIEIRPDYDPIAHIRGKVLWDGSFFWNEIFKEVSAAHRKLYIEQCPLS